MKLLMWFYSDSFCLGFEVLTTVFMKSYSFWNITKYKPSLAYSSTLKMEATSSSNTSVDSQQATWHYISGFRDLQKVLHLSCPARLLNHPTFTTANNGYSQGSAVICVQLTPIK
jgi:hypothetical protein